MRINKAVRGRTWWFLGAAGVVAACSAIPGLGTTNNPPLDTGSTSVGSVTDNGVSTAYRVDTSQSRLFILVKKRNASGCGLFHPHSIAALGANFTYALNRQAPAGSTFSAQVIANGLDADQDAYRNEFEETRGHSFTDGERADIRANMLGQLEASSHPFLTFSALNLTTLDGTGTADLDVTIRGATSRTTMNATATWSGTTLTINGLANLDGSPHGLPRGNFSDCVDNAMVLKMHLVMVPGQNTGSDVDASVPPFVQQEFPDESPCGPVGYDDVKDSIALNCGACHGNPVAYGATEPLTSWRDFHVNSNLYREDALYLDAWDRVMATDGRLMPPMPHPITMAEKDLLISWFESGAHRYRCDAMGMPLPERTEPPAVTCASNSRWLWDDPDSSPLNDERMFPGEDCLGCHAQEGEAPQVTLGGTVFRSIREEDRCFGWTDSMVYRDLRVEIVDADDMLHSLPVNASGNFLVENINLPTPYTASVVNTATGARRDMIGPQTNTSCNACHSERGTLPYGEPGNPPAGRIVAPGLP